MDCGRTELEGGKSSVELRVPRREGFRIDSPACVDLSATPLLSDGDLRSVVSVGCELV